MEQNDSRREWQTERQPDRVAPEGMDADAWQDKEGRLHREPPPDADEEAAGSEERAGARGAE